MFVAEEACIREFIFSSGEDINSRMGIRFSFFHCFSMIQPPKEAAVRRLVKNMLILAFAFTH